VLTRALQKLQVKPERAIWFEHGASENGTPVGCGVDQAHLHVIVDSPFSFSDFASLAIDASDRGWQVAPAEKAYATIPTGSSYLLAGSCEKAILLQDVEGLGPQFFRRIVAHLSQRPDEWNYRQHPHLGNVKKTIQEFSQLIAN
jgi:hypothetical protein